MSRRVPLPGLLLVISSVLVLWAWAPAGAQTPKPRKVQKTDAEWSKVLTREQFLVTRKKATEPAGSGKYAYSHTKGTYSCVCCGAPLFSSQAKFESGTGWPSFWMPIDPKRIDTARDMELGYPRLEVMCMDCGAHLGHVFDDGPPPTGLRYCINSASLKLQPAAAAKKTTARAKKKQESTPSTEATQEQAKAEEKDAKSSVGK